MSAVEPPASATSDRAGRRLGAVVALVAILAVVVAVVVVLHRAGMPDRFLVLDNTSGEWAYVATFLLVFGDAICALLPGETTLNTAATLAADGQLQLGLVMVAGAAGAVAGDSALYWIARAARTRVQSQLDRVKRNDKVAAALGFMGDSAPLMLVVGRYVPGLRFVVNATFGLAAYPYRRFLLWSAIGGTVWSVYTCGLAYVVGTALAGFPLASIIISGAISTIAVAAVYLRVRHQRRAAAEP